MTFSRHAFLTDNSFDATDRALGVLGVGFPVDSDDHQVRRFRQNVWNKSVNLDDVNIIVVEVDVPIVQPWVTWSRGDPVHCVYMRVHEMNFAKVLIRCSGNPNNPPDPEQQLKWLQVHHTGSLVLFGDSPMDLDANTTSEFSRIHGCSQLLHRHPA